MDDIFGAKIFRLRGRPELPASRSLDLPLNPVASPFKFES